MKITIEVIPHAQQRYNTCGDWQWTGTETQPELAVKVSDTGFWQYNLLIARHELDEAVLCAHRGVSEKQVDEYDLAHPEAGGDSFSENTDAPYYESHCDALASEWQFAHLLGVDWPSYTKALNDMGWPKGETHEVPSEVDVRRRSSDSVAPKTGGE